jgi:hypothetical protein
VNALEVYFDGFFGLRGFFGLSGFASVSGTVTTSEYPGLLGCTRSGTRLGGLMCVIGLLGSGFVMVYLHEEKAKLPLGLVEYQVLLYLQQVVDRVEVPYHHLQQTLATAIPSNKQMLLLHKLPMLILVS